MMPIKTQTLEGKAYVIFDISNTTINAPKEPAKEVPIPVLGPDVFDPRKADLIYAETHKPAEIIEGTEDEGETK